MRSLKIANTDLYHIMLRSAAAYALCAVVSIVFLVTTYRSYAKNVEQKQPAILERTSALVDEKIADLERLLVETGRNLETVSEDNIVVYRTILDVARRTGEFETVVYFTGGRMYTDGTEEGPHALLQRADEIQEAESGKVHSLENVWEEGDLLLLFPLHITKENGQEGTLAAVYDCSRMAGGSMFEELHAQSACWLMEDEGKIVSYCGHDTLDIAQVASNNFYMQMYDLTEGSRNSKSRIQQMRHAEKTEAVQSLEVETERSHTCLILIKRLSVMEGYSIAAVTDMNVQNSFIFRFLRKTILMFFILFLLSAAGTFLIWRYVRGVTQRMEAIAYADEVTKGKNINYFRREAANIIQNHTETPYIVQRFDISNFRYLNEAYGHLRADDILKACVDIYQKVYSTKKELCVRMDSDQFVTLTVNDNDVNERREEYIRQVNDYAVANGITYPIRMKYGIYQLRKQDRDVDVMIDRANAARRSLNGNEVESVAYYTDAIMRNMSKVNKIESEMQQALDNGEFQVYLQAKWDIVNDHVAGAEALVRWIRPEGNMVFPDEFIPVFEKNGFIGKLDFYMLENVCKTMRSVLDAGGVIYPVSVNQSRVLLHSPEYIDRVKTLLDSCKIPKEYIELEVTETALFDDRDRMISVLNAMKREGIKLSMDDFGSGYSSLNTLKDMPFDVLKIDREFFSEAVTSDSSTLILHKIIEMADGLGMEVICEGVENEKQVELLRSIGCRRVQGYYYAKPVPAEKYIQSYCQVVKGAS
ncbi:MAG: GGDEF domain-containing phosphodiesterase [bacterium]|nr:GGDEF domain-containing phosphodiesterase [bacterium]